MPVPVALVRLFVAALEGDVEAVEKKGLRAARTAGAASCREALRLVHLFAGFPRNLTALEAWERAVRRLAKGHRETREPSTRGRASKAAGRALFDRIYAQHASAVRARLAELDPSMARWVEQHAYGSVLSQCKALEDSDVECLAVAALVATNQERQLISHILGAIRCGAPPRAIRAAARVGAANLPATQRKRLLGRVEATLAGSALRAVSPRRGSRPASN
ncbi:MAG: hypothetical protein JNJ88_05515 [Planctomycetes bacterium]|nr:hypothetical protein [Planctomycetota bacterium]